MSKAEILLQRIIAKPDKWIVWFLMFLLLFSIAGIIVLKLFWTLSINSFAREVGKTLLQIIAVSVIGTTATLLLAVYNNHRSELIKEVERNQQRAEKEKEAERVLNENKNQFRKDILHRLTQVYADVKKARRMLRAKAFATPYYREWNEDAAVLLDVYDKQLDEINDSQLTLEIISREIKASGDTFIERDLILKHIKAIEECLKEVVTEYEINRSRFGGTPAVLPIRSLEKLKDMLGSERRAFAKNFFGNTSTLFACLNRAVLNLNTTVQPTL